MIVTAVSSDTYWLIAFLIGVAAAVVVAALLVMLLLYVGRIRRSVEALLRTAGEVGANTAHIPKLEATAPVLAEIVDEAVVQDGYMNALTDGFGPQSERSEANGGGAEEEASDVGGEHRPRSGRLRGE